MKHLDAILKLAENEFEAIEKNGKFRSREEIDSVYKLVDIVKDTYEIWKCEDEMEYADEGYSGNYSYERGNRMNRGGSYYDGGNSYARGRGRNDNRDGMGRYASRGGESYRVRGGYSRMDKAEYMDHLRGMMEDAPDEQTRMSIKRMIDQMDQQ